ncbi:hypothetical protein EJ05DRAFT_480546 [Pseudovirgaria hyperparasitica]|uniref:Uncharacterized protein n=1 Tax=Pseudovirgaria hyperparasitica TaxID=470096 RepID=A0A6A6VSI9_9PEZI|nr:uncharacterized protein EJ05DRAFT_480546 [Pseudovirgaria hyperparasitica]KAF2753183.1 hypothetical protein EJ05DRAFT_480546 [Pseudovirgaria hyperparasitica]
MTQTHDDTNIIEQIAILLRARHDQWESALPAARGCIASLDARLWMQSPVPLKDKIYTIEVLQSLAFADADSGGVDDIANWCLYQLMALLYHSPNDSAILRDIGQNWLQRAQPYLAAIHIQYSTSSSSNSTRSSTHGLVLTASEEERLNAATMAEAEERLHTSNYVEARGILVPATEYFSRAVEASQRLGSLSGHLLIEAAEAFMSLGNVSYSRTNEQYFRRAIHYLRMATAMPTFNLPAHLQQYLDDYGRFVD